MTSNWPDKMRSILMPGLILVLAACAQREVRQETTAGHAEPAVLETSSPATTRLQRERAITAYREHLTRYPDSPERDRILRRLADLQLEQATDAREEVDSVPSARAAARHYQTLLERTPEEPARSEMRYQLARALMLSNESRDAMEVLDRLLSDKPQLSPRLHADALFRQGELRFDMGRFAAAEDSYRKLVALDGDLPLHEHARYKLGWSLFRQQRHPEALEIMLDFLERDETALSHRGILAEPERIRTGEVLRVISMSLDELGGAAAVDRYLHGTSHRNIKDPVLEDLATYYEEQDRIMDAAGTWRTLALGDLQHPDAPQRLVQAIALYEKAGFRQPLTETRALLVLRYGPGSDFRTAGDEDPVVTEQLRLGLKQLARHHGERAREPQHRRAAEHWYRTAMVAYPEGDDRRLLQLELAGLLRDNGRPDAALEEYERLAWEQGSHRQQTTAALGALSTVDSLLKADMTGDRQHLLERMMQNSLRFVAAFPAHEDAVRVLSHAGRLLLEEEQYDLALALSRQALEQPASDHAGLTGTAWSIQAQAHMARHAWSEAAKAYSVALREVSDETALHTALRDGLATARYRQAEEAREAGRYKEAQQQFSDAARTATGPELAAQARYGAASLPLLERRWSEAIVLLEDFRKDFPDHPLQVQATRALAHASEQDGRLEQAAQEYRRLGEDPQQPHDLRRESLLHAAVLFTNTGDLAMAIKTREAYHDAFPQPADSAVDNLSQLARLESERGNENDARRWQRSILQLHRKAGTAHTRNVAARAALALAGDRYQAFQAIALTDPVQARLAEKIEAMERAIGAFEQAMDYGVAEVVSASTYHIASLYDELGSALLSSPWPAGLTDRERTQYESRLVQQAEAFRHKALELHQRNLQHTDMSQDDPWVSRSARRLTELKAAQRGDGI